MNSFDPAAYGRTFEPLLVIDRRRPLDAGKPIKSSEPALRALTIDRAFADKKIADHDMAACCLAGVWLLHDYLDESHNVSQGIDTPSGSFWHGIMHRREGDFSNAKYWFRRVGTHPVLDRVAESLQNAGASGNTSASFGETRLREYDPFDFVDRCQAIARGKSNERELCLDIQQAEWECLFDHCYRTAIE